ncbi:MAG: 50S ribosomal protein L23 [Firmicutes bacterium]|nr:50S ribosomal protein L23 [Bacillota bacterium]
MKDPYSIIIRPVISEESTEQMADRKYIFIVDLNANKIEIKQAVEHIFKVKVAKVNTLRVKPKFKRMGVHRGYTARAKKAIVTITEDSKPIPFFEAV